MNTNGNGKQLATVQAPSVVRQEFAGTAVEVSGSTASEAVAAQAQAQIQARYIMALKRPRDWDSVRQRLLAECKRPGFAEAALYRKPIGKGIEGLSIRFAEAALRAMGNVAPETQVIFEDTRKRIVRVSLTDLESNLTFSKDIVVEKTVERSQVKEGQEVLGQRTNSYGKATYLVAATEDDLLNKQAALESKALRSHALRLLPGDISDEAEALIRKTLSDRAAQDPSAARKQLIDAFGVLGVSVEQLKAYVGHPLEQLVPAELVELRAVHAAVRDGEATWAESMALKDAMRKKPEEVKAENAPAAPVATPPPGPTPSPPKQSDPPKADGCPDCAAHVEQFRLAAAKSPRMVSVLLAQAQRKHPEHAVQLEQFSKEVSS